MPRRRASGRTSTEPHRAGKVGRVHEDPSGRRRPDGTPIVLGEVAGRARVVSRPTSASPRPRSGCPGVASFTTAHDRLEVRRLRPWPAGRTRSSERLAERHRDLAGDGVDAGGAEPRRHPEDDVGGSRATASRACPSAQRAVLGGRPGRDLGADLEGRRVAPDRLERGQDRVALLAEVGESSGCRGDDRGSTQPSADRGGERDAAPLLAAQPERRTAGRQRRRFVRRPVSG